MTLVSSSSAGPTTSTCGVWPRPARTQCSFRKARSLKEPRTGYAVANAGGSCRREGRGGAETSVRRYGHARSYGLLWTQGMAPAPRIPQAKCPKAPGSSAAGSAPSGFAKITGAGGEALLAVSGQYTRCGGPNQTDPRPTAGVDGARAVRLGPLGLARADAVTARRRRPQGGAAPVPCARGPSR